MKQKEASILAFFYIKAKQTCLSERSEQRLLHNLERSKQTVSSYQDFCKNEANQTVLITKLWKMEGKRTALTKTVKERSHMNSSN
jgi:hypothetical protein